MKRAVVALVVTVVAVVLLAGYETRPPAPLAREAARPAPPGARAQAAPALRRRRARVRTGTGKLIATPFSSIQVRVTLTRGRLTGVETLSLSGSDPRTQTINARAEPLLRAEALEAGSADIDVVSGATYTSESYKESLQSAIDRARGRSR